MITHAMQSCNSLIVTINFIKNEVGGTNRGKWRHQLKRYSPIFDLCYVPVKRTYSNEIQFYVSIQKIISHSSELYVCSVISEILLFWNLRFGRWENWSCLFGNIPFLSILLILVSYVSAEKWNSFVPSNVYYIL